MFEIRTVMTAGVLSVKKYTPINDSLQMMVDNDITGMPVINEDMTIAGIISEKDVLELLHDVEENPATVEDFMTTPVYSFDQDDNLIDVCDFLIKHHFRRVPITYDDKLVGIITRKDIVKYIVDYQDFFRDVPYQRLEASS